MLFAIDTTEFYCGLDGFGEPMTTTREMSETRRRVTVEEAVNLPETTRLYWGDKRIHRPGYYAGARWNIGPFEADTLAELVASAPLSDSLAPTEGAL